jgi:putative oxidoreductase
MAPHESEQVLVQARIGALRLAHEVMKVLAFTIAGFDAFLERSGYPGFFAYLVLLGALGGSRVRMSRAWPRGRALVPRHVDG